MTGLGMQIKGTIKWIFAIHFILLSVNLYSQSSGPGDVVSSFRFESFKFDASIRL